MKLLFTRLWKTFLCYFLSDSYDDRQVQYQWTKLFLREHDMTEFYVEKQTLRLEPTSFITGTSGIGVQSWWCNELIKFALICLYAVFTAHAAARAILAPRHASPSSPALISCMIDHFLYLYWKRRFYSLKNVWLERLCRKSNSKLVTAIFFWFLT